MNLLVMMITVCLFYAVEINCLPTHSTKTNSSHLKNTTIYYVPELNLDIFEQIISFSDEKTVFLMSQLKKDLTKYNRNLINKIKLEKLRKNCPKQFHYLTQNAYSMFLNSFDFVVDVQQNILVQSKNSNDIYHNKLLRQQISCFQSMFMAKDLISNRLEQLTIELPPYFEGTNKAALFLNQKGDRDTNQILQKLYDSVKLLIDTGSVKKIKISPLIRFHDSIDSIVEQNLYQFLSTLEANVSSLQFEVSLSEEFALNTFLSRTRVNDISFVDFNTQRSLSNSIEKLKVNSLGHSHVPNINYLRVEHCADELDLLLARPKLQTLQIITTYYDDSFLNTICSENAYQLKELSIGFTSNAVNTQRLYTCLMALKPTLRKLSFSSKTNLNHFWNTFLSHYLEYNAVIQDLSILYEFPGYINLAFLDYDYNQLMLRRLSITGYLNDLSMDSLTRFVAMHTYLQSIELFFLSPNGEKDHLAYLPLLFSSINQNLSIRELDLSFGLTLHEQEIEEFVDKFTCYCKILGERTFKLNGLRIGDVIRDLMAGLDKSYAWKKQDVLGMVTMGITSLEFQRDSY